MFKQFFAFVLLLLVTGPAVSATLPPPLPILSGTTSSLGGSALTTGNCVQAFLTIPGVTATMGILVSPNAGPGVGFQWFGFYSSANTVLVKLCALAAGTPTATTYNVRVLQ